MRITPISNSFSAGELSPRLMGRTDSPKYNSGAEEMTNFIALAHGGVTSRGGTRHIAEVRNSAHTTRLIAFEYSVSQTYALEFGNNYIRFYTVSGGVFGQVQSGNSAYEVATSYLHTEVNDLQVAQVADVMWIVHPNHPPRKLTRLGHTNWSLVDETFKRQPMLPTNTDESKTLAFSDITSTTQNITANTAFFDANHVGIDFLIDTNPGDPTGEVVWVRVNSVASNTVANVTIKDTDYMPQDTNPTSMWQEGAFSSVRGFPSAVVFYEQRLWYAGTTHKPQTLWASKQNVYEDFTLGSAANDSLSYAIASDRVNEIKWLAAQRVLIVGTTGGEFRITGGNESAITPTNVDVRRQTSHGSKQASPVYIGSDVMFIQRSGTKVRNVAYKWESDSFASDDMTFLAEHITKGGLTQLAFSQVPDPILLAVRADGDLIMMTYEPSQEVVGWHRHETKGLYKNVTVLQSDGNDLWVMIIQRTINGQTKQFIEIYDPSICLDSYVSYSGNSTTAVSGLNHLEGETVTILADNAVHPDKTVTGGQITLDYGATDIKIGLRVTAKLIPTRYGASVGSGTALGKMKRWNEIFVLLENSAIPKINGERPAVRNVSTLMGVAEPPTTGDIKVTNTGYDREGRVVIEHDLPLPCHIVAIFGTLGIGN